MDRTALVLAPHPDDAELGMAGTLCALAERYKTVIVDLSDGEPTPFGTKEIRAQETEQATQILGVHSRLQLDIACREIFDTVDNRKKIAGVIRKFRPDILFVPYWEDAHPDHVHASQLCDAARFYSKLVKSDIPYDPYYPRRIFYYFSTHLRVHIAPSFIVDISPYMDRKRRALEAYQSQFVKNPANEGFIERVITENAYWGQQCRVEFGEPFVCRESLVVRTAETIFEI